MAKLKWNDIVWTLPDAMVRMQELEAQLAEAQRELAEARKLSQWTEITSETIPKKSGDDFYVVTLKEAPRDKS